MQRKSIRTEGHSQITTVGYSNFYTTSERINDDERTNERTNEPTNDRRQAAWEAHFQAHDVRRRRQLEEVVATVLCSTQI